MYVYFLYNDILYFLKYVLDLKLPFYPNWGICGVRFLNYVTTLYMEIRYSVDCLKVASSGFKGILNILLAFLVSKS